MYVRLHSQGLNFSSNSSLSVVAATALILLTYRFVTDEDSCNSSSAGADDAVRRPLGCGFRDYYVYLIIPSHGVKRRQ